MTDGQTTQFRCPFHGWCYDPLGVIPEGALDVNSAPRRGAPFPP